MNLDPSKFKVKTTREIWGVGPAPGYEWDAGSTPVSFPVEARCRISVKLLHTLEWTVYVFFYNTKMKRFLREFPKGDEGEREAKRYALALVEYLSGNPYDGFYEERG